ncbi:hypothetical protein B4N84_07115 [Flavobacterium sp. IR1]|nr:hypothetical protein B4N84_07115 [Flavobacterium sp. IR1]
MKANKPSLIMYFLALISAMIFDCMNEDLLGTYAKSIVIPAIFFYFLTSNNFKIQKTEAFIFLFCFIGQVYDLMKVEASEIGGVLCFFLVYMLLLKLIVFDHKKIRLRRKDILPLSIVVILIIYLLISVLGLQSASMKKYNFIYTSYGIILSILCYFSYANYITKGSNITLLMTLMTTCYMFSDIFYIFNVYFSYSVVLVLIRDATQILAYFFMVEYFLEKRRTTKKRITQ